MQTTKDKFLPAIAFTCGAIFLFTLMQAVSKTMAGRHDVLEVIFYRNVIGAAILLAPLFWARSISVFKTTQPQSLIGRVIIGNLTMICIFASMRYLPMANVTVLVFASTLIVPVAAHFFLKEKIGLHRWIAVFIGLSGVILIAQPSAEMTFLGVFFAIAAAFGVSYVQVVLRHMKGENPFMISFYFMAGGALCIAPFMPWLYSPASQTDIILFLIIGLAGGIGQYFLTMGLRLAPASLLNPFQYTGLIWSVLFDIFLWGAAPTWYIYAGSTIIFGSYIYILYRERKHA